jgi:hypothetical protein
MSDRTPQIEELVKGIEAHYEDDWSEEAMNYLRALITHLEATHRSGLAEAIRRGKEI